MATKLVPASSMQKGKYVVVDGIACRVVNISTSRPGKHGHAKVRIEAIGLIDDKKREMVVPGHDNVETPIIEKKNAQVLYVHGNKVNVMDSESHEVFDLDVPDELKGQVKDGDVILYWDLMGEKVMKQIKSD